MSKSIEPKNKLKRREKSELKGRLHSFLMFLPNMVRPDGRKGTLCRRDRLRCLTDRFHTGRFPVYRPGR